MSAIAQYPDDFSYFKSNHLARIPEINEELPGINANNPMAIDAIAMLLWLDGKYGLDNRNQIVFDIRGRGLSFLQDFHINVTFRDPAKAEAAQQLNQAWEDMQLQDLDKPDMLRNRFDRLEARLYSTASEVLFVQPSFTVDSRRPRYVIPEMLARTTRVIHVRRTLQVPMTSVAYTIQPNGAHVIVP